MTTVYSLNQDTTKCALNIQHFGYTSSQKIRRSRPPFGLPRHRIPCALACLVPRGTHHSAGKTTNLNSPGLYHQNIPNNVDCPRYPPITIIAMIANFAKFNSLSTDAFSLSSTFNTLPCGHISPHQRLKSLTTLLRIVRIPIEIPSIFRFPNLSHGKSRSTDYSIFGQNITPAWGRYQ